MSPVPVLPTPIVPCSDSITTADGTSCSITGSARVGLVDSFIVPSFPEALVPQSAVEAHGAISILSNNHLKIFDVHSNSDLLSAISNASPLITSTAINGQYTLQHSDIVRLTQTTASYSLKQPDPFSKQANIARYYSSTFNTLHDAIPFVYFRLTFILHLI